MAVDGSTITRPSTASAVKHVRNASQHLHGEPAGWRDRSGHDYCPTACVALDGRLAGLVGLRGPAVRSGMQDFSEHGVSDSDGSLQKPFRAAPLTAVGRKPRFYGIMIRPSIVLCGRAPLSVRSPARSAQCSAGVAVRGADHVNLQELGQRATIASAVSNRAGPLIDRPRKSGARAGF